MSGISLTTELDAINSMLTVIGESPVSSVENTGLIDAVMAQQILRETMRHVQSRGWTWNKDFGVPFDPSFPLPGEIVLPANTLSVAVSGQINSTIVQRGVRLWDRKNQTFLFFAPVVLDITRLLPFEELPQAARHFILVRSARIFQDRVVGSQQLSGFNEKDEFRAYADLRVLEAEAANYNVLDTTFSLGILGYPDRR